MKETPNAETIATISDSGRAFKIDSNIKAMTTHDIFDRMALAQQEYGKYFGWKAAANFLRDMAGLQYAQENDEKAEMLRSTAKILDGELRNVYQEWANRYKHVVDAYWTEIELRQQAEDERQQKERPNVTAITEESQ